MKVSVNKKLESIAKEFHETNELRKELARKEKVLKTQLKEILGDNEAMSLGNYLVSTNVTNKRILDSKALKELLGTKLDNYKKDSIAQTLTVKKIA